jgi:hypothetical protein
MITSPEMAAVDDFLARSARRQAWRAAAGGAAAGFAAAIAIVMTARAFARFDEPGISGLIAAGVLLAALGAAVAVLLSRDDRRRIAYTVERRAPRCRNLVITASELPRSNVDRYASSVVATQAAHVVRELEPRALFPVRFAVALAGVTGTLWLLLVAWPDAVSQVPIAGRGNESSVKAAGIARVDATLLPPAYTGAASTTLRDPSTIDALAGTRVHLTIRATAPRIVVETRTSSDTIARPAGNGPFAIDLRVDQPGFIAIAPLVAPGSAAAGPPAPRRLIGLAVHPDLPPRVRITAPARDIFLTNRQTTLDVAAQGSDDFGLTSLLFKYTKVSGADERFTFVDGVVPATIVRRDARTWTSRAAWNLAPLQLEPGDMVVYRAVAIDNRPGALPVESDAFIAQVPSPGSEAAAGFSIDPEQDRAAVSQQMVILKTERLLAARPAIAPDSFAARARDIAAEQRKVRAEFVFMLGGELADAPDASASMTTLNEAAEAEGESDLAAGRNENAGHAALLVAIRAMSRADAALTAVRVDSALGHERIALTQLERAFSHSRIILRALAERERLDLSRRLSGTLTDATGERRPAAHALPDSAVVALRAAFAEVATLAGPSSSAGFTTAQSERAAALGDRVLRIDPAADALRDAAAALSSVASLMPTRPAEARAQLDRAAAALAGVLRATTPQASGTASGDASPALRRLRGALDDALRKRVP